MAESLSSLLTFRLTDPAPMTPGTQLRRYRGVRWSRFVSHLGSRRSRPDQARQAKGQESRSGGLRDREILGVNSPIDDLLYTEAIQLRIPAQHGHPRDALKVREKWRGGRK